MFGLFKSPRRKASDAAIAYVKPVVEMFRGSPGPGFPPGFWDDPYVLGFFYVYVGFAAKMAIGGKATGELLGHVLVDTYSALSNMNGARTAPPELHSLRTPSC